MERDVFIRAFCGMYEGAIWPVERAWEQRPFADATELRRAFEDEVLLASVEEQETLIAAYSDIAEPLPRLSMAHIMTATPAA